MDRKEKKENGLLLFLFITSRRTFFQLFAAPAIFFFFYHHPCLLPLTLAISRSTLDRERDKNVVHSIVRFRQLKWCTYFQVSVLKKN